MTSSELSVEGTASVKDEMLDEQALAVAAEAYEEANGLIGGHEQMRQALKAYLAAAPSRDQVTMGALREGRITKVDILREWFGGERYARDYEYLDASYGEQAERVATYIASLVPTAEQGVKPLEWVERTDDRMPVSGSSFVDVRYRDGDISRCVTAGGLPWSIRNMDTDITAFRIVPSPFAKSEAADAVKAAYFEGWVHATPDNESVARTYAEKNWPNSQAQSDHEALLYEAEQAKGVLDALRERVLKIRSDLANFDGDKRGHFAALADAEREILEVVLKEHRDE